MPRLHETLFCAAALTFASAALAQSPQLPFTADHSVIAPNGTAYVERIVPVPNDLSPEARHWLAQPASDAYKPETLAERRKRTDDWQNAAGPAATKQYPVKISYETVGGVRVRRVDPMTIAAAKQRFVLINLHGGGFNSDSGSWMESVPIANLTGVEVLAVFYRLAPEHPYPAALDDAIAVYRETLKTHKPSEIGIYGTSAGAILTAEVCARIKQLGLPQPAVAGIFSGSGDLSTLGDSYSLYSLTGFSGHFDAPRPPAHSEYAPNTNLRDPVLSPIYSDLHGMPPTLFVSSGRDLLLSATANLERAYMNAGVETQFVIYDALPHAFWYNFATLPEAREANATMAKFLLAHLGK